METIQKILVPVDFSDNTDKLVDYALYMGQKLSARLLFLHVVTTFPGDAMLGTPYSVEIEESRQTQAKKRMDMLLDDISGSYPDSTGEVLTGEAVDEIVAYEVKQAVDLIIISTHGAKGLEKILLGSVAERVVHRAHCPVLFMNPFKRKKQA